MFYAEGRQSVHHGVDHRRGGSDGSGFADAFDAQWIAEGRRAGVSRFIPREIGRGRNCVVGETAGQEATIRTIDNLLENRLCDSLRQSAMYLSSHQMRTQDRAAVVHAEIL